MYYRYVLLLFLLGPSSLFRCSPSQRKPQQFYCLSVSRQKKKLPRCVGFVIHFTRKVDPGQIKVDQRQVERRRNEKEFVKAQLDRSCTFRVMEPSNLP